MRAGMSDEDWEDEKRSRYTVGDRQFSKWEKIATLGKVLSLVLGKVLSLVLDACLQPSASGKEDQTTQ